MNLNGKWKLYYFEDSAYEIGSPLTDLKNPEIPFTTATVPGNVELDLSAAGILPDDLLYGKNILEAEKFEIYEWWYEKSFTPSRPIDGQTVLLHFGAVDCYADYYLNGVKFASSEDMFIEQDFDVTDLLNYESENVLHVNIHSPIRYCMQHELDPQALYLSWHRTTPAQIIRKAPHSFGWDIMPRALSAGIWRDVELRYREKHYFKYLYFYLHSIEPHKALGGLLYESDIGLHNTFTKPTLVLSGKCDDHEFRTSSTVAANAGKILFDIPLDKLWWPKNYGKQPIYELTAELYSHDGELLCKKTEKTAFRKLELIHSEIIEPGGKFEFRINDTKIMALGSNWVPMDVYHSRDKSRYEKAIELVNESRCNILRCWGGNVYEDHEFYDLCDSNGIMVWQDFSMACHFYPQDERFKKLITAEAESVIKKLRLHPSIVVWSGDNEVDSMVDQQASPAQNYITREVLPRIVERLDPKRPYITSSPYISEKAHELGRAYFPEDHLWGPRDYYKSRFYTDSKAYFVSETGYHGCPNPDSIKKFISPEKVWPYTDNDEWNLHSTDQNNYPGRVMLMHNQVLQIFGEIPDNLDDYALASQISQAEAKKFFIERVRARADVMGGIIWWNLLDGWPQMSDAVVDYYYGKKLAFDYIRRSQNPVLAFVGEMGDWGYPVLLTNARKEPADVNVKITDAESGNLLFEGGGKIGPASTAQIGKIRAYHAEQGMYIIEFTYDGKTYINSYLYGTPKFNLDDYKSWLKKLNEAEKNAR